MYVYASEYNKDKGWAWVLTHNTLKSVVGIVEIFQVDQVTLLQTIPKYDSGVCLGKYTILLWPYCRWGKRV